MPSRPVPPRVLAALPWLALAVVLVLVLRHAGVPVWTSGWFLLVQAVGYAVPGTLLWRAVLGSRPLLHDAVFGFVLFHAVTVLCYLALRALGVPFLVWVPAALTVLAGALLGPGKLRRASAWESPDRFPAWFAWSTALGTSVALLLVRDFAPVVSGVMQRYPGTDAPYGLALAGELKHHVPPTVPFVVDERLNYHWFSFADAAAASWQTGVELDRITLVLLPMTMLVAALVSVAVLGARFAGNPVAGAVALWTAVGVGSISTAGWFDDFVTDSTLLRVNWFGSPTQAYAQGVLGAVLGLVLIMVRSERLGRGAVAALVVLTIVLGGSKATFLPVLGAGVALALLATRPGWLRRRWWALGMLLGLELLAAQVILFGGASQGMSVSARSSLDQLAAHLGLSDGSGTAALATGVAMVLGWFGPLLLGLAALRDEEGRRDPFAWLLLGMVLGASAATLLLTQPGFSQFFFLRAGLPYGYLLAAAGAVRLWARSTPSRRRAAVAATAAGLGACLLLRALSRDAPSGPSELLGLAAATAAVLLVVGAAAFAWSGPTGRGTTALLLAGCCALGFGAARTADLLGVRETASNAPRTPSGPAVIPAGGIEAARYLRAQSDPDTLVATNAHCRLPAPTPCQTIAHWMSAWSERHFLVEGWGYTASSNEGGGTIGEAMTRAYDDPGLLRLNDAVFTTPTKASLQALLAQEPVDWLLVDSRFPVDLPALEKLLPRFERFGRAYVFAVR